MIHLGACPLDYQCPNSKYLQVLSQVGIELAQFSHVPTFIDIRIP